ncbi:MAG: hypothetical protein RBR49_07825 [Desulfovibrio desulfuricans]|uniref:hypothetical protein n=1 Tax=Desulfovibrio sp. WGS1351 TaxID=3366814 RepID=UPI002A40134A|nr:hypothetical protein [Desulfovibrio desulfuricans]
MICLLTSTDSGHCTLPPCAQAFAPARKKRGRRGFPEKAMRQQSVFSNNLFIRVLKSALHEIAKKSAIELLRAAISRQRQVNPVFGDCGKTMTI